MLVSTRVWFLLDRDGWPIETIKGHTLHNFFRLLLLTRRVVHTTAVVELPAAGQRNRRGGPPRERPTPKDRHTWKPGTVDPRVGTLPCVEPPEAWDRPE